MQPLAGSEWPALCPRRWSCFCSISSALRSRRRQRLDVFRQPSDQLRKPERVGIEQVHEVRVRFVAIAVDEVAVHPEESVSGSGEGQPVCFRPQTGWLIARLSMRAAASSTMTVVVPICGRMTADSNAPASRGSRFAPPNSSIRSSCISEDRSNGRDTCASLRQQLVQAPVTLPAVPEVRHRFGPCTVTASCIRRKDAMASSNADSNSPPSPLRLSASH